MESTSSSTARASDNQETPQQYVRQYVAPPVDQSKVVRKPVSNLQVEDPRAFQLQQLRRRFSPKESSEENGTVLSFSMAPSDPDFPFEMEALDCVLHVPLTYPNSRKPSLDVKNKEMGRGYQINVERGFDALIAKSSQLTLLGLMNALDKQLESLLTEQKAETVKIVTNAPGITSPRSAGTKPSREESTRTSQIQPASEEPKKVSHTQPTEFSRPEKTYTPEQRRQAEAKRESETRQVEARLGRLPLFFKSSDGIAYTLPIEPRKRADLPVPLQAVKSLRLFVPLLYPLQCCRIELHGVSREAATTTEKAFEKRAMENPDMTLMAHINHLTQNMHVFATEPIPETQPELDLAEDMADLDTTDPDEPHDPNPLHPYDPLDPLNSLSDRPHIKIIPRPPEWSMADSPTDSPTSDSSDPDFPNDPIQPTLPSTSTSRATPQLSLQLSLPSLELHGIELLELVSLSVTVRCDRCQCLLDVRNLHSNAVGNAQGWRNAQCGKCARGLAVSLFLALAFLASDG